MTPAYTNGSCKDFFQQLAEKKAM